MVRSKPGYPVILLTLHVWVTLNCRLTQLNDPFYGLTEAASAVNGAEPTTQLQDFLLSWMPGRQLNKVLSH